MREAQSTSDSMKEGTTSGPAPPASPAGPGCLTGPALGHKGGLERLRPPGSQRGERALEQRGDLGPRLALPAQLQDGMVLLLRPPLERLLVGILAPRGRVRPRVGVGLERRGQHGWLAVPTRRLRQYRDVPRRGDELVVDRTRLSQTEAVDASDLLDRRPSPVVRQRGAQRATEPSLDAFQVGHASRIHRARLVGRPMRPTARPLLSGRLGRTATRTCFADVTPACAGRIAFLFNIVFFLAIALLLAVAVAVAVAVVMTAPAAAAPRAAPAPPIAAALTAAGSFPATGASTAAAAPASATTAAAAPTSAALPLTVLLPIAIILLVAASLSRVALTAAIRLVLARRRLVEVGVKGRVCQPLGRRGRLAPQRPAPALAPTTTAALAARHL
eukprot:scaffold27636_cov107-Isochrysis_galbana.AAC.2